MTLSSSPSSPRSIMTPSASPRRVFSEDSCHSHDFDEEHDKPSGNFALLGPALVIATVLFRLCFRESDYDPRGLYDTAVNVTSTMCSI